MTSSKREYQQPDTDPSERFGYLFDLIGDAVVELEFVETTPVVRAVNPAFEEVFGYDRERVLGQSLNEFIIPPDRDDEASAFDQRTATGNSNHAIVRRQTATGIREFLYRGVPYERQDGRQFGFAIYSDFSEQRTYERHIRIVHRILRHNLRNELSVILGAASELEAESSNQTVQKRARQIIDHARELSEIGEEVRALDGILTENCEQYTVDLGRCCREIRTDLAGAHPDASITVELPESFTVTGIAELETAIRELAENGVVHNDGTAHVELRGRWETKRLVLEIVDDGPGIPQQERIGVFDTEDITQLRHGSGLGLWLARCAVESSGGQIAYERENGRTVVRLSLRPG